MKKSLVLLALTISMAGVNLFGSGLVEAFSNTMPDGADTGGGADVVLVNANTRYVRQTNGRVRVWFPNNNGSVEIRYGNFCSGVRGDYVESEDGAYGQWGNGANITRFNVVQTGQTYIGQKGVNCAETHTFTFNNINEQQNGYYYRDIDIDYVGGNQNPFSGAVNDFVIAAPGQPNARIGMPGDDTGFQTTQDQVNNAPTYTSFSVPFGTSCSLNSAEQARIYMYDLDNAGGSGAQVGRDITVTLYDRTAGNNVNFDGSSNSGNPGGTWRPANLQNDKQWVSFTARPDHKYRLEIHDVYFNNTIQYSVPYAQIFSEACVAQEHEPTGTIISAVCNAADGQVIKFKTNDEDGATQGRIRIGPANAPNWTSGWQADGTQTVTVPAGTGGMNFSSRTYNIRLDAKDKKTDGSFRNNPVEVDGPVDTEKCPSVPQTYDKTVTLQPFVDAPGGDVEPTEPATYNGRVHVDGFPTTTQWGYNEYSAQLPAVRVTATPRNTLETDGPYTQNADSSSSTSYSCPHAQDDRSGSSCRHNRNAASNDTKAKCVANGWSWDGSCYSTHPADATVTVTYSCPNGTWVRSGSTCSRVRYKCETSGTWGAWNASAPSCPRYWTCPGGAAGSGYYFSEPSCQGWKCQYADAVQQNPEPTCEFRCSGAKGPGTGPRAEGSNGSTSTKCYQPPSFVLKCYWDTGRQTQDTVRSNGDYCLDNETRVGVTIGLKICRTYSAEDPQDNGGWSPSNAKPGYGKDGAGWRQITKWGWDVKPGAEKCVRVVAKPTVKIAGGDVSAGGLFATGANCNPGPTSAIAGWPHETNNAFDASGTQYGAFASGNITGFATATIRSNPLTQPARALAFANRPLSGGEQYGGNMGTMPCAADHNGLKPANLQALPNLDSIGDPAVSGPRQGPVFGGQVTGSRTIQRGKQLTVYVTGNVYIGGNITYERNPSWTTKQDIPAFKLVVSRGNIYIAPGVSQLDGIYIAQPEGNVGGHIYTCANAGGPILSSSLYDTCKNTQLTINGVFIAKQVHLLRTQGTAIRGETAEQFNYLPELWLANWAEDNTTSQVKYDAIISLPPVL